VGSYSGRVTVPGKPADDLARGTLNRILKQAGLASRVEYVEVAA